MRIAIVSEMSACDKNKDIVDALEGRGHKIINAGMKKKDDIPELTYIHTGLMAAILLNTGNVDLIVGGCGTGQGFLNSVMQYPGVFCGHILTPLDAWLFAQINDGNCISLALNQGYGWGGEINLRLIFDNYFSVERGGGFPEHRKESQLKSRKILNSISERVHYLIDEIISRFDDEIIYTILKFPNFLEILNIDNIKNNKLKNAIKKKIK